MSLSPVAGAVCGGLWFAMVACLEVGYRVGHRDTREHTGLGGIEAAVFALLGLLLGFSFADGMARLERRTQLIVSEINAISSAYQLVGLLAASQQPDARRIFRAYLEERLRAYEPNAPEF